MNRKIVFTIFFLFFLFATLSVSAQLPPVIQKIIEYNTQVTLDFSLRISFLIAFLAGILGIFSPCILPFLPAYFSYTFKEKKNLTLMTLVFFVGFSLVFVSMGIIAGFLGEQTLVVLQKRWLVTLSGVLLLFLGGITLLGRGFSSFIRVNTRFSNDVPGVFLMGMAFALGWTACLGPILAGILGIAAILGNMLQAALLLFFYALGSLVPLFILSFFYDRLHLAEKSWVRGKVLSWRFLNKQYEVHSSNLIAGVLLILVGLIIIFFEGTGIINSVDLLGTKQYFYSFQNMLLEWEYANIIGVFILVLLLSMIGYAIWRWKRKL